MPTSAGLLRYRDLPIGGAGATEVEGGRDREVRLATQTVATGPSLGSLGRSLTVVFGRKWCYDGAGVILGVLAGAVADPFPPVYRVRFRAVDPS